MQIKAAVVHEKTKLFQNGKPVSMFFGQSSFATHSVINQKSAVKVDADVDLALVAPMGCGIQTGAGAVLNTLRPAMNSSPRSSTELYCRLLRAELSTSSIWVPTC